MPDSNRLSRNVNLFMMSRQLQGGFKSAPLMEVAIRLPSPSGQLTRAGMKTQCAVCMPCLRRCADFRGCAEARAERDADSDAS